MSKKTDNFLNQIKPGALQLWDKFGVLPSVAAGQAALESAWGTSGLATKYNNLFGIKGAYKGNSAMMDTWEVYGGQRYDIKAGFRAYPDWSTSILDYGVFLTVNKRYKKAIGVDDYKKQIKAIHEAGYATDPNYQSKIISIIEANGLADWDKQVLGGKKSESKKTPTKITGSTYTVKSGDTLSEIATRAGVTVNNLVVWNNIKDRNKIQLGQKLTLNAPPARHTEKTTNPRQYIVKSGDTLSGIAAKFNTTVRKLQDMNNIKDVNKIHVGQVIKLTAEVKSYKVKSGDALSKIAKDLGTTVNYLAAKNNIKDVDKISVGQVLYY